MDDDAFAPYLELVTKLVLPLVEAADSPEQAAAFLEELGYLAPSEVTAFTSFGDGVGRLTDGIDHLLDALEDGDAALTVVALGELLAAGSQIAKAAGAFSAEIQANFAGTPLLADTDILAQIGTRIVDHLVARFVEGSFPTLYAALLAVGIIELEDRDPANAHESPHRRRSVHWNRLSLLFSDPVRALKETVCEPDEFLYERFMFFLRVLAVGIGLPATYVVPDPDLLEKLNDGQDLTTQDFFDDLTALRFPLVRDPNVDLGLELYPRIDPATHKRTGLGAAIRFGGELNIPLGDSWTLSVTSAASLGGNLGVTVDVDGSPRFVGGVVGTGGSSPLDAVQFGLKLTLKPSDQAGPGPVLALGLPLGATLQLGSAELSVGLEKLSDVRFFVETDVKDALFVFGTGSADGFVSKVVGGDGLQAGFSLGLGLSNVGGVYFKGASGLVIRLPLHLTLGPIDLNHLSLEAEFKRDGLNVSAATGLTARLGPLAAAVEDVGVRALLAFPPARDGNLGPVDLAFAFQPPKGVGLSLDVGVVRGGGYLFIDPDRGEYAGALELALLDVVTIKAIGIITTKLPDGGKGFSLLILMSVEFGSGFQLGLGFTLSAVGGLIGLNRTMNLQALADGVRTGAIESVMFPHDIIANAPKIISDLRTFFPQRQGTFLIGPMVKIGWGTPTLASISLGIVIEIPGDIAIVGMVRIAIPADDVAVIVLQVNFVGAVEFDKKRVWFFASLFESRIAFLTIDGEMGLLVAFGADANFVVSVGGFHPRFAPPPLPFPSPQRIAVSLLNSPMARVRIEGYFAVTSNTVQFGAQAEVFFGVSGLSVQGHVAFDALFQFSPFYFVIDISASFSVKVFGIGLFSVRVKGFLDGPTPWHMKGHGSISLLFWDIDVDFETTWGEPRLTEMPPVPIKPIITAEFGKTENWRAIPPAGVNLLVTLRSIPESEPGLVLHPVGVLRFSQRALPLGLTLDRVGAQKPSDYHRLSIDVSGGALDRKGDAFEQFAPAQFQNFSDADKLSKPAFAPERSGIDLSAAGTEVRSAVMVRRVVRYEEIVIDTHYKRFARRFRGFFGVLFDFFLNGAAVSKCELSQAAKGRLQPFTEKIDVQGETYSVVNQADNTAFNADAAVFPSEAGAREYLNSQVAADPSLADTIHVIPTFEVVPA
ncbi:hypothetical protein STRCI_008035 [Streptomyces cinnabarinus]|uniref:DUF6603 domain-containing protein n=1 Tax=Streptomyces cinnabarinus TaxID=67287 RepID=A0ABY7KUQ6_9ACTN|nr:DUF6603 domain-containing protein [Streptomyces cinnabarinus]WAZ26456.1 hypothetical protein STRCI_008035 [Streptomyces cinnabarinus]